LVVSGDTLGMHIAIGLAKLVVAWFGLTCEQEIELYGRGVKLVADVPCRPCWQKECAEALKCHQQVKASDIVTAVKHLKAKYKE
jgi:ADP-heptose:LPS heptosyltransferase